jgi:hypothetical protein
VSYCRWSSEDFTCDLYVYASDDGWVTCVAGMRVVWPDGVLPDPVPLDPDDVMPWLARSRTVMALLEDVERMPIGLPFDSGVFVDSTPGECADRIEMLRGLGYNCPAGVVAALREEQGENMEPGAS